VGAKRKMSVERARALRKNQTETECRIWRGLRLLRREGLHFRRQAPIGRYYADFACHGAKLVLELDGSQHDRPGQMKHDAERTRFLESVGYRVVRLRNVEANEEAIADYMRSLLRPHPQPLPSLGEGSPIVCAISSPIE
jgi:very-short-patch-repair endonuclease